MWSDYTDCLLAVAPPLLAGIGETVTRFEQIAPENVRYVTLERSDHSLMPALSG